MESDEVKESIREAVFALGGIRRGGCLCPSETANIFYDDMWQCAGQNRKSGETVYFSFLWLWQVAVARMRMNEMQVDDTFIYANMSGRIILRGEASEWCVASASFAQYDWETINERGMSSVLACDADILALPVASHTHGHTHLSFCGLSPTQCIAPHSEL